MTAPSPQAIILQGDYRQRMAELPQPPWTS